MRRRSKIKAKSQIFDFPEKSTGGISKMSETSARGRLHPATYFSQGAERLFDEMYGGEI